MNVLKDSVRSTRLPYLSGTLVLTPSFPGNYLGGEWSVYLPPQETVRSFADHQHSGRLEITDRDLLLR